MGVSGSCLGQAGAGEDLKQECRQCITAQGCQLTLVQVSPMQGQGSPEFPSMMHLISFPQGEVTLGSSSPVAAALLPPRGRHTPADEGHSLALPGRLSEWGGRCSVGLLQLGWGGCREPFMHEGVRWAGRRGLYSLQCFGPHRGEGW